jgi:hypothetical protein
MPAPCKDINKTSDMDSNILFIDIISDSAYKNEFS